LDEYVSLKFKSRNQFWFELFAKWWEKYPWKLGDKEEPPLDDPTKMSELAYIQGPDEHKDKSKVEAAVIAVSFSLPSRRV